MLAFGFQMFVQRHSANGNLLAPLVMIAVSTVFGLLLLVALRYAVPPTRRAIRRRMRSRRRLRAAATSELRSRMLMDELCPFGWQAHITVFSSAEDLPPEATNPERVRVALDWAALGHDASPENVTVRRIWAESINLALEAMVADRMTDETLQSIELRALSDGAEWPDA